MGKVTRDLKRVGSMPGVNGYIGVIEQVITKSDVTCVSRTTLSCEGLTGNDYVNQEDLVHIIIVTL